MRCAACAVACAGLALIAPALALLDVPLSEEDLKNVENAESDGWVLGRVNGVSTDGLVTKRLRALDGAGAVLGRLTAYMEDVVDGPGADFNCGVRRNNKWVKNLGGFSAARSFPLASDGCVSMATERAGDLKTSPDDALEMTAAYTELQFKVAAAVVKDVGEDAVRLFKKPSVGVQWHHSSGKYKRCTLERVSAIRFRPKKGARAQWYFLTGITNTDQLEDLPDYQRYHLNEWIGVDATDTFVDPMPMSLRPWDGKGGEAGENAVKASENPKVDRTKFTTSFERWGGRVSLSAILSLPAEDSPALKLALEKSDVAAGQAQDALTYSNIGILALPMALNIIPVALVADVSSVGLFVYTIMTDILTTIPFIIKGFELFIAGSTPYAAQEVYYTGEGSFIVAESWSTECHLVDLRLIGSIFIAVGFTMLFLGVFLEHQAQRLRSRWIADGTLLPVTRHVLKADGLEADMRKSVGLSPHKPSNRDVAEEEQSFLDHQVKTPPPKAYSPGSTFSSSTTSESRLERFIGVNGPGSVRSQPNSGKMGKRW